MFLIDCGAILTGPERWLDIGSSVWGNHSQVPQKSMKAVQNITSGVALLLLSAIQGHAALLDTTVSITPIANSSYVGIMPTFPSGTTTLGGVTFDLPSARPDWQSNIASAPPDLSASLTLSIDSVSSVHFLVNTGNTYTSQMSVGDRIGTITLSFASTPSVAIPLQVGVNVREWGIGSTAQPVINTFTSPDLQEIWRGNNNGGILCAVDMLTIPVSGFPTLTGITIQDESTSRIGQINPVLTLKAVTVQSVPEPTSTLFLVALGVSAFCGTRHMRTRPSLGTSALLRR